MKYFLCSFSNVGSLIKEEIENKKSRILFQPNFLREGYTDYVARLENYSKSWERS